MTPESDTLDELFRALATERRRLCVECLAGVPAPISVEELVRRLTGALSDASARELRVMLLHGDLPFLVEADVLEWTDDGVTPGSRFSTAEACLDAAASTWGDPDR